MVSKQKKKKIVTNDYNLSFMVFMLLNFNNNMPMTIKTT